MPSGTVRCVNKAILLLHIPGEFKSAVFYYCTGQVLILTQKSV